MQLGMVGLGRMGANMVRRLMKAGHECVVYDVNQASVEALANEGATGTRSTEELMSKLTKPRAVWMMLPAGITTAVGTQLAALMDEGDILIDGGNSDYRDAVDQAKRLASDGIRYLDVGTSGGVRGLERGYCLMIGGDREAVGHLDPIFSALSPGPDGATVAGKGGDGMTTARSGYLHCGPAGAGHFVKMVHNGIEYGMMAAYAEGFNILKAANAGSRERDMDAETTPLSNPGYYRFDIDVAAVSEVWRHGSVISSWLLDLTADAFASDPALSQYSGRVSDSGEGRWTLQAAIDTGVPAPVLAAALFGRFTSRGNATFTNQVLSAMRHAFGGHLEKASANDGVKASGESTGGRPNK